MKKLMTMLSAVALAFGVQAAGTWHSGTSFESMGAGAFDLDAGEGLMWQTNGTPTLEVLNISGAQYSTGIRSQYYQNEAETTINRALSIKTTFGQPVFRTNDTAVTMGEVFVDTLVKPTICEDDQITLDSSAKIAIWFKEIEDGSGNIVATNLMVTAGYLLSGGGVVTTNYNCGTVDGDPAAWQRFTIKSFADIGNGANAPGFVVFRNGVAVTCSAAKGDATGTPLDSLNIQAGLYHKYHELFPSAVQEGQGFQTISAVGFDGTGTVDDILFTDDLGEPAFNPFTTVKLAWEDHVTGFVYKVGDDAPVTNSNLSAAGTNVLAVTSGSVQVNISDITYAAGYIADGLDKYGPGIAISGSAFNITKAEVDDTTIGIIKSQDDTPNVYVINGTTTNHYINLAAAVEALNKISGDATLKLNAAGLTLGEAVTLDGPNLTGVTIDLAGETITYAGAGYAITTAIPLTITDTATGGSITANEVVTNTAGRLTIDAGTFTGKVAIGGTAAISGGTFNGTVVAESATHFLTGGTFMTAKPAISYLATGYAYSPTSPWVVGLATYDITYIDGITGDEFVNTPATYQYGDTVEPAAPAPKAGYKFAGWTWKDSESGDIIEYEAGVTLGSLELTANWTPAAAPTFTLTAAPGEHMSVAVSTNGVGVVGANNEYTIVSNDTAQIVYTADQGYKIDGQATYTTNILVVANVTVVAPTASQSSGWDPDPTQIDENKTAAQEYPALAGTPLATANAKKLTVWAAAKGVDFSAAQTATTALVEAYLLNCAPANLEAEKAEFKLDISFDGSGNPVVSLPVGKEYNVTPTMKGSNDLSTWTTTTETTGYRFFKYELSL